MRKFVSQSNETTLIEDKTVDGVRMASMSRLRTTIGCCHSMRRRCRMWRIGIPAFPLKGKECPIRLHLLLRAFAPSR